MGFLNRVRPCCLDGVLQDKTGGTCLLRPAGGYLIETTFGGSSFAIPLDREDDLVNALRPAGYEVRRDDRPINSLGV